MGLIAQQGEALFYTITADTKATSMTAVLNRFCFHISLSTYIGRPIPPALLAVPL
jgi:hypothetical protein